MFEVFFLLLVVASAQPRVVDVGGRPAVTVGVGEVARTKATCPFIGSLVARGGLGVVGSGQDPLASISEVIRIGNTPTNEGFGELLAMFAEGNHGFTRGGQMVPGGMFSLDFPFSQGSHPGDSGILQGDRNNPSFSAEAFQRFASFGRGGVLEVADVGRFIAANVKADRSAKTVGRGTILSSAAQLVRSLRAALFSRDRRRAVSQFTKLLAVDNIAGSSGEFALFFSLLANRRDGRRGDVLYIDEMMAAFRDKQLPRGWESWVKKRNDWLLYTLKLSTAGYRSYATGR